jgi:hypothetical protein
MEEKSMRNLLRQRLLRLETATKPSHPLIVDQPFLSRDELYVAIVLRIRQVLRNGKGRPRRATNREAPESQKFLQIVNKANDRMKAIRAAGLEKPIVASLKAKGYSLTNELLPRSSNL